MLNKYKISIVIPTYEVPQCLLDTIKSIYSQKEQPANFELVILIDGNSNTAMLEKLKYKHFRIVKFPKRMGQSSLITYAVHNIDCDIIVLTNDDVLWTKNTLSSLIEPFYNSKTHIVAGNVVPLKANCVFENILNYGNNITRDIANNWNNADNYLTCNGRLLALKIREFKHMRIPSRLVNNDAYIYFFSKIKRLNYDFSKKAKCFYRSPSSMKDYLNQNIKFKNSFKENRFEFQKNRLINIEANYSIPFGLLFWHNMLFVVRNPFLYFSYICIYLYASIYSKFNIIKTISLFDTDISTKKI